jgi:hypothetical protein
MPRRRSCGPSCLTDRQRGYPAYELGPQVHEPPIDRNPLDAVLLIGAVFLVCVLIELAG